MKIWLNMMCLVGKKDLKIYIKFIATKIIIAVTYPMLVNRLYPMYKYEEVSSV